VTARIVSFHSFKPKATDQYYCTECDRGSGALAHRLQPPPPHVTVQAIADLNHLVLGQRLLVDGELHEVVETS
jgi:hypothetical protein